MKWLVIWDWNNTLVDTMQASFLAMQKVAHHYHVPLVSKDEMMNVIGSHRDYWKKTFGDCEEEAVHYYLKCYENYRSSIRVIDGAEDVLSFVQAKSIPQIILSNEDVSLLIPETHYTKLNHYFDGIQGTIDAHGKPELAFAQKALQGFEYDRLILIGDGVSDIQMAHALNAVSICVFDYVPKDIRVDYRCATLFDVQQVLQEIL